MIESLMAQADMIPKEGDNPWIWATGVLIVLAGFLGREVLKDRDEWRSQAKASTVALAANTEVLRASTTVVEAMHKGNEDLVREVHNGFERLEWTFPERADAERTRRS